jgi:hypothetical protein
MIRRTLLASFLCGTFLGGACARERGAFERNLRAGRWQEADAAFRADSGLQHNAGALRDAARIHASPDSATWDPSLALDLLGKSRALAPGGWAEADARLEQLLAFVVRERATRLAREAALADSLERARADADRLRGELAGVRESGAEAEASRALLQRIASRLESDLREREAQISTLRGELDRLREIDLTHAARPKP